MGRSPARKQQTSAPPDHLDHAVRVKHPPNFGKKIHDQLANGRELVRLPLIVAGAVPVVMLRHRFSKAGATWRHAVGIVEADQPVAVRIMQRKRIAQPMRPFWRRFGALDPEFQPIALFEVMNTAVEVEQEFQCVFVRNRPPRSKHVMS
jgi:hypothetical protein